jgi:hypothetical protein
MATRTDCHRPGAIVPADWQRPQPDRGCSPFTKAFEDYRNSDDFEARRLRWLRACEAEEDQVISGRVYAFTIAMLVIAGILNLAG